MHFGHIFLTEGLTFIFVSKYGMNNAMLNFFRPAAIGAGRKKMFICLYIFCQALIVCLFNPRSDMLKIRGPLEVMATLCSKCAAHLPSRVTAVQLSSRTSIS